jgi:hypothetical protein
VKILKVELHAKVTFECAEGVKDANFGLTSPDLSVNQILVGVEVRDGALWNVVVEDGRGMISDEPIYMAPRLKVLQ